MVLSTQAFYYAITVWGYTSELNTDNLKVKSLQNKAARAVFNNYDHVNVEGINLVAKMKVVNVRQ